MSTATGKDRSAVSREERLAAKLRENLRRRKQQARTQGSQPGEDAQASEDEAPATGPLTLSKDEASG